MTRTTATALALLVAVGSAGCATIMQGTTQDVGVSSQPTKAEVTIDGQQRGTTPLVADLKRKDTHTIRIDMDGYQPYEVTLTKSASGWVWGNIVFGGFIGLAVDAISGGLYKLSPAQVEAQLQDANARGAAVRSTKDGLYVFATLAPRRDWKMLNVPAVRRGW